MVTGYLRRRLSSAAMCVNVKCLLERLAGEGQEGQAGRRREEEQAGKDYRQKSLPKGRLSLTVMLRLFNSATFYLIHIFNPLIPCLFMPDLDLIGPFKDFLGLF